MNQAEQGLSRQRRRRFLPLSMLAAQWAAAAGESDFEAVARIVRVLRRHRHCLAVECNTLSEIKRGVTDAVMDSRRREAVTEIDAISRQRDGFERLSRYTVRLDSLVKALRDEAIGIPAFLPEPPPDDSVDAQNTDTLEQAV